MSKNFPKYPLAIFSLLIYLMLGYGLIVAEAKSFGDDFNREVSPTLRGEMIGSDWEIAGLNSPFNRWEIQGGSLKSKLKIDSGGYSLIWNKAVSIVSSPQIQTSIVADIAVSTSFQRATPWVGLAFGVRDSRNFNVLRIRFGKDSQYQILRIVDGEIKDNLIGTQNLDIDLAYGYGYRIRLTTGGEVMPGDYEFYISSLEQPEITLNSVTLFSDLEYVFPELGYAGFYVSHFNADGMFEIQKFSISGNKSSIMSDSPDSCFKPLDLSLRPMMFEEFMYTHYFPEDTWKSEIEAFSKILEKSQPCQSPRLFPLFSQQKKVFSRLPIEIRRDIRTRANGYVQPSSDTYFDLNSINSDSKERRGPAYARELNHKLLDVVVSWVISGNNIYSRYAEDMIQAIIREFTPKTLNHETADFVAHADSELIKALAISYDLMFEVLDNDLKKNIENTLVGFIEKQLAQTRASYGIDGADRVRSNWWIPYHNWTAIVSGSMGMAALVVEGRVEGFDASAALWTAYSTTKMWLDEGFDPAGANLEGNHYIQFALSYTLPFIDALRSRGGPNLFEHSKLSNSLEYIVGEVLPGDSGMLPLNAHITSHYSGLTWDYIVLMLAKEYDSPVGLWVWQKSLQKTHPLTALYYPVGMRPLTPEQAGQRLVQFYLKRGLANFRTGWSGDDIFFTFMSGPFHPTTHGHSDENNFTLYAYGNRFAVELGPRYYGSGEHNTVLVDGKGQAVSTGNRGVDGRLVQYGDCDSYSYVMGDAKSAYDRNSYGQQGIRLGRADRHIIYAKGSSLLSSQADDIPAYFIIYDDIQRYYNNSIYTWQMYSDKGNSIDVNPRIGNLSRGNNVAHIIGKNNQSRLEMIFLNPDNLSIKTDEYDEYPLLKVEAQAVNPDFLTIAIPVKTNRLQSLPDVVSVTDKNMSGGVLKWSNCSDFIALSRCGNIKWQQIESDAKLLKVRLVNGRAITWLAIDATFLKVGSETIFAEEKNISVMFDGGKKVYIEANQRHRIN